MDFFYPLTTRYPYQNGSRNTMLKEIMNDELNYECFDCHRAYKTPEYVSLNNAIFLCADCAEIHRQLPDYISVIVPNRIKNFSNEQLKLLYYGGNRKLLEFISYEYPKLRYLDPDIRYKTVAMEYYRKYIRANAFDLEFPEKPSPNVAYKYNKKIVKKEENEEKNFIESMQDYIDKEESDSQKINRMGSKEKESPWDTYSNKDFFKLLNKTFGGNFFGNDEEKDNQFNKTYNFPQTERMKPQPKIETKESENIEMKNEESEKKEEKEEKEEKKEKNNNEDQEMKNEEKSHPYFKRQSTDLISVPKEANENENESDDSFMGESYYKKEDKNDKMDIEKEEIKTEDSKKEEIKTEDSKKEDIKIEDTKKEEIKIEEPKKEEIKTEDTKKEFKKGKPTKKLGSKSEIIFHSKPNINQLGYIDMYPDAEEVFLMSNQ